MWVSGVCHVEIGKIILFSANTLTISCILVANAAKIRCDCGGFVMLCGSFTVRKWLFYCINPSFSSSFCGENVLGGGGCDGRLRRKCDAKMAKWWCGDGGWVVYLRRVDAWFPVFWLPMWRNCGAMTAVSWLIAACSVANATFWGVFQAFIRFICGENMVWKRQKHGAEMVKCGAEMVVRICDFGWNSLCYSCYGVRFLRSQRWNRWKFGAMTACAVVVSAVGLEENGGCVRRKLGLRIWFLYDLGADGAFGNL